MINSRRLRIALAQINTTVGDLNGNAEKIIDYIRKARDLSADIVAFPEMATTGYPPEDLLFKTQFVEGNLKSLETIREATAGITAIVGFVDSQEDIFNSAAVFSDKKLAGTYHKIFLPNYGVFDENRYFRAGDSCQTFTINNVPVGVSICEDMWYEAGPPTAQAFAGAEVLLNISASPYHAGKGDYRLQMMQSRATDNLAIVAMVNLTGGQDELVFDGNSLIIDEKGAVIARGKSFEEDFIVTDIDVEPVFQARLHDPRWRKNPGRRQWPVKKIKIKTQPQAEGRPAIQPHLEEPLEHEAEIYKALVTGTRDYVKKNGFQKVVIGLSGGVDSTIVATIATDALGPDNVIGVAMPSMYSSIGSISDSDALSQNLGIALLMVRIDKTLNTYLESLAEYFQGTKPDTTEENIQARIRGNLLMALSNKFGWLVLTTGNKSEYATGYSTLYGDMAGGFAVIKDVVKTMVYKLARYRNTVGETPVIPRNVLTKEPSAELRPDQKDSDSLPPYDVLDPILVDYVEEDKSVEYIVKKGFAEDVVKRVAKLVDISEYKRRQAPIGIKISPRAFGRDRRLPITNKFREY
jgi:NAD+ synthase (glutamine-hydrolysing)